MNTMTLKNKHFSSKGHLVMMAFFELLCSTCSCGSWPLLGNYWHKSMLLLLVSARPNGEVGDVD
jgi:hypothetical protein